MLYFHPAHCQNQEVYLFLPRSSPFFSPQDPKTIANTEESPSLYVSLHVPAIILAALRFHPARHDPNMVGPRRRLRQNLRGKPALVESGVASRVESPPWRRSSSLPSVWIFKTHGSSGEIRCDVSRPGVTSGVDGCVTGPVCVNKLETVCCSFL